MHTTDPTTSIEIERHRTAISRPGLSLPVQCLLRDSVLSAAVTLFDYGCGRGHDVALLQGMGIVSTGWDPVHQPASPVVAADVVNLGYVINVIEDLQERFRALRQAWDLCRIVLVVSAQLNLRAPKAEQAAYADGVITSRRTFQKYYTQAELRTYLESQLDVDAIPAAPGVFYLFKDETAKQHFLMNRYRRPPRMPAIPATQAHFEQNLDILQPLLDVLATLGRPPLEDELPQYHEISRRLGSMKRALNLIRRTADPALWESTGRRRSEDLLVYLALARFHRRPNRSRLPLSVQRDVKAFFGTYKQACEEADTLLFRISDADAIDQACQRATTGHLVDNALMLPISAIPELEPILRIYEGCARALIGEVDDANVVKLHRFSGKVTYLVYANFESDPCPPLRLRVKVSLRSLDIDFFDYSQWDEPHTLESKALVMRGSTQSTPDH